MTIQPLGWRPPWALTTNSSLPLDALRQAECVRDKYRMYLKALKALSTLAEMAGNRKGNSADLCKDNDEGEKKQQERDKIK